MKSLCFEYPAPKKMELVEYDVPALKPGEILCKATKSLVSTGTEMTCLKGEFDEGTNWFDWVRYPFRPGYSMAAVVVELGPEVKGIKIGDRVATDDTHMQLYATAAKGVTKIPDKITDEEATWIPLCRVAQNVVRKCQIQMGDSVVIIGAGQVGQLVINFARLCGATKIISVDPIVSRNAFSVKSGATHTLAVPADQAVEKVKEIAGQELADTVIDSTGHPAVLAEACKLTRTYGKIGLVGDTSVPSLQCLGPGVVNRSLTILGAHGTMTVAEDNPFYPWTRARVNGTSLQYMEQGRLNVDHLVTHRFSPMEAPEVYMKLLNNRSFAIGVIFDWEKL